MSAEYELQKVIVAALKADATVDSFVANRIYDRVPPEAAKPYVHIRGLQAVDDDSDCLDAWEVFVDLDVWSAAVGKPEAERAGAAVRDALHEAVLTMPDPYALCEINWRSTDVSDDEGGLLTRARMVFVALVEAAEVDA